MTRPTINRTGGASLQCQSSPQRRPRYLPHWGRCHGQERIRYGDWRRRTRGKAGHAMGWNEYRPSGPRRSAGLP